MRGIDQLFSQVIEASSDAERYALLSGLDERTRAQLQELMAAHQEMGRFLEGETQTESSNPNEQASLGGESVGPYAIVEQIGEGGFGVVFMAEHFCRASIHFTPAFYPFAIFRA